MAVNMKRKQPTEEVAPKTSKRQKADGSARDRKPEPQRPTPSKPSTSSILSKEQPAFPRGGAGLLTPLEKKQISARAARDAVAEQSKSKDLFTSERNKVDDSEDEEVSLSSDVEEQKVAKNKSKRKREKGTRSTEDSVSIEGLSYKRLAVGSLILGRISAVNLQDLSISLPNNLTGFVPLTSISAAFTRKIETALQDGASDDEDEETGDGEEKTDVSLDAHFAVGQYLRVAVTSLGEDGEGKAQSKKKITLSLDPQQTNAGLTKSSLAVGCTVQTTVLSVEDHGVVVDLGIGDGQETLRGFIPTKALSTDTTASMMKPGAVLLCVVTALGSNGKIVKLSNNLTKVGVLKNASSVEAFLPGTLTEVLVTELSADGIAGKLMGLVDVTADVVHSGSFQDRESFVEKFKIGQKLKGRLIHNFPLAEKPKLAFSILPHITEATETSIATANDPTPLKVSSIVPSVRVVRVVPGLGVYVSLQSQGFGFVHVSRLSDKRVDTVSELTGAYKLGSEHKARVLDIAPSDGLYILSLQDKVIEQPFLRVEDVAVGVIVKVKIEKLFLGPSGVQGVIVNLAEGVTGMVPQIHMSDVNLLHPEKKFREGHTVTARVLSTNLSKRQIRLTLKKSLVNSDQKLWTKFEDITAGDSTIGTLVKIDRHGALVQFYGNVRGFLPVAEMSEAYIKDATEHFKVGQVLTVNALSINAGEERLTVSCRDRGAAIETALATIEPGTLVSGTIFEKSQNDVLLRLEGSDVIARLAVDHASDGSEKKRRSALEKVRVGQKLENVLVLDVLRAGRLVVLCNRPSLIKAAQNGQFLKSWEGLKEDALLTGFVSNITEGGVFVRFADGISGLITKQQVPSGSEDQKDFGLTLYQAVTARVSSVDYRGATPRFWLSMKQGLSSEKTSDNVQEKPLPELPQIMQPVDASITSFTDFAVGKITEARITSIKETQINVELAKDIQGRIDVSEVFDQWDEIKDRKQPLKSFSPRQTLKVRVLGAHDTRNHRFLPLTHRSGKNTVFELSAKPSTISAAEVQPLSLSDMRKGMSLLAYVNNIVEDCLMVNVSPSVRGRIRAIDVSDDLSLAADLDANFPIGSAIRAKVKSVDLVKNHLDLTGKSAISDTSLTFEDLSPGMILPGRVTKISDRSFLVQLSENIVGAVDLIDIADDYAQANTALYQKNDVIRVSIVRVDTPNKKIVLSTRPSKVLSSSLKILDPEITSFQQLHVGDVVRGFISNVADKGLFVALGHGVTAFVRVTNLSDAFLKSWKDSFQRDQLVKGKVISIDESTGHIQLSLKDSVVTGTYKQPVTFTSLSVGDIVTGKVVKVETFGVFILVDNSENVRGLCHRSEIAEQRVEDASKLFNQGDAVKAKVLKLDLPNRRINFGMKVSYFDSNPDGDQDMEDVDDPDTESEASAIGGVELDDALSAGSEANLDRDDTEDSESSGDQSENVEEMKTSKQPSGLSVGGFDWYGMSTDNTSLEKPALTNTRDQSSKHQKKKRKSDIQIDRTGDLDVNGPQSTDDFERLLLGEPDSSMLWLQYMAFHLELGDVDAARQISERALKSIGLGQESEKLNVWIAMLNLENAYGDDETLEAVFKRALEYNDAREIYSRLVSIYIQSGKHDKADTLFQEMLKKFTQDPKGYINYATFLFDTVGDADRGRGQLTRALQVLPNFTHFDLTSKFAQLEFKSSAGLPERGRTIFEGLINSFPKRVDLFNVLLDLEIKQGDKDVIRALFERIFDRKLKPKQAKYFFKRWLAFEEAEGDERRVEEVKAKAATWVKSQT